MTSTLGFTSDQFKACEWKYDVLPQNHYGYSSVMRSLQECAKEKTDTGRETQAHILELLGRATSMMLTPNSLNEPFKPIFQDFQAGKRSALPEDFTSDELEFFENILNDIDDPWLKARLVDLLWLIRKPKNPDHARIAIESYISHSIDPETWRLDVNDCWERAARLTLLIRDIDKLNAIKS
jgi:hypothetical protein